MNARAQDVLPSALDRLRAHRAAVTRLHDTLATFNSLTAERNQLGGAMALVEAAITAAKSVRWPDPQEIARLLVEQDKARDAAGKFARRHRDDLARAERLQSEYAVIAGEHAMQETLAAALLEHAMTEGIAGFADVAELFVAGYIEWAATWRAVEVAHGRTDAASTGIGPIVTFPAPLNAPKSAALATLAAPRDLTQRIEQRAREIAQEIQSA